MNGLVVKTPKCNRRPLSIIGSFMKLFIKIFFTNAFIGHYHSIHKMNICLILLLTICGIHYETKRLQVNVFSVCSERENWCFFIFSCTFMQNKLLLEYKFSCVIHKSSYIYQRFRLVSGLPIHYSLCCFAICQPLGIINYTGHTVPLS